MTKFSDQMVPEIRLHRRRPSGIVAAAQEGRVMNRGAAAVLAAVLGVALLPAGDAEPAGRRGDAAQLSGRPGAVDAVGPVYANGLDVSLLNPGLEVRQSPRRPGRYQRVCARSRLFQGRTADQAGTSPWTPVSTSSPRCRGIAAAQSRTFLPGALFTGLGRGKVYATDTVVTWRARSGRVLARLLVDFGQARDYSCLALGGCDVRKHRTSSFGVVFSAPPAPPPVNPPPPPPSAPFPHPGSALPGGHPISSDTSLGYWVTSGNFFCGTGSISVVHPETAPQLAPGVVDYYRDNLWWWDTTAGTWQFWTSGRIRTRVRGGGWTDLQSGQAAEGPSVYALGAGLHYAVTQQFVDGYSNVVHHVTTSNLTDPGQVNCPQ